MSIGFQQCVCDPCSFVLYEGGKLLGLIIGHVDEFLFAGKKGEDIWEAKCKQIRDRF